MTRVGGRRSAWPTGRGKMGASLREVGGEEKQEMCHGWLGRVSVRGKTVLGLALSHRRSRQRGRFGSSRPPQIPPHTLCVSAAGPDVILPQDSLRLATAFVLTISWLRRLADLPRRYPLNSNYLPANQSMHLLLTSCTLSPSPSCSPHLLLLLRFSSSPSPSTPVRCPR